MVSRRFFCAREDWLMNVFALLLALLLDAWWGEPRRWHPLVGFGALANGLEKIMNNGNCRIVRGCAAWCVLVLPLVLAGYLLQSALTVHVLLSTAVSALILYFALGLQSLREHANAVAISLRADDLSQAQRALALLVSRDTQSLDHKGVSGATVESVLENGSDAVIASLFWFAIAGIPGGLLHRAANTLDAMWGYRTVRFNEFGRVAARIDDVLNFIPARITACAYALIGKTANALSCWRVQARMWSSPNAGPVMAAGAGALQLQLGGAACYHGEIERRPLLGCGRSPREHDIERALQLLQRSVWLIVGVFTALSLLT
jgi:adenosylcobinamide-phosphate synthase